MLRSGLGLLAALGTCVALALPASAGARTGAAATIAGPDPAIVDLGGVAMAADGTGGVVFRRFEEGAPHVYAARYDGERWHAPQRLDVGQRFTSSWPRIGAADHGRLVVTWVQQGPPNQDSLYSAVLPRGGSRFLPPTLVDFTIGDSRAAFPSLAMSSGGDAVLVYQRVTSFVHPLLGTGYVNSQIKLARFNGSRWSGVGTPVNRVPSSPLRQPTAENAPRVAIAADGSAVVAWQEPDEALVDRVWARRVFGSRLGTVLPVTPPTFDGGPQRGAADAIDAAITDVGRVVVAVRQQPDPSVRGRAPRIYVNQLDEPESGAGKAFGGPRLAAVPPSGATGAPTLGLGGRFGLLVGWEVGGSVSIATGQGADVTAQSAVGPALAAPAPALTQGIDGRGVLAAATTTGGGRVIVRELDGTRVTSEQAVAGPTGGPVGGLRVAGAGNGNALVAFHQGESDEGQIAVARVDAPPVPFVVEPPGEWTNLRRPTITWSAPANDPKPRGYAVEIDGRIVARTVNNRFHRLKTGALRDGRHRVRVIATSRTGGGETATASVEFGTDRRRPTISVKRVGKRIRVRVVDPGGRRASGVAAGGTTIDWGDDDQSDGVTRSASHRYEKAARRTIVVRAQDEAGNVARLRTTLRVPRG
jgi:hypothetical protein